AVHRSLAPGTGEHRSRHRADASGADQPAPRRGQAEASGRLRGRHGGVDGADPPRGRRRASARGDRLGSRALTPQQIPADLHDRAEIRRPAAKNCRTAKFCPRHHRRDLMSASSAARELFAAAYGREPGGVWSAPGRVNLIGEHTDYNEGYVLPFAIQHRTYAAVGSNGTGELRVASTFADSQVVAHLDELDGIFPTAPGQAPGVPEWSAYVLGVAWAL